MDMPPNSLLKQLKPSGASCIKSVGAGVLLGLCGFVGLADSRAQADPIPLSVMSSLQPGTITAVHHETVLINGKEYGFDAEVQARDQDDNHLEVAAIRPNLEVKFHVKKNESNKIDLIIVYMPQ